MVQKYGTRNVRTRTDGGRWRETDEKIESSLRPAQAVYVRACINACASARVTVCVTVCVTVLVCE